MSKYAIRLLKNKFYPLVASDNLELEEGELVVFQDEIGEDVGKVFRVNQKIQEIWDKKETEKLIYLRRLSPADKIKYNEQKIMEEEGFIVREDTGLFAITNLGAMLLAKQHLKRVIYQLQ